ncbi:MAG: hypothetical protein AMJ76_02850 [Dehalococcoidia bacterium SM23_28_1]|nr:MAG: hypothetical protein AMJ76_02850 [Dehalococcoidia bacterium SM23_28_1]
MDRNTLVNLGGDVASYIGKIGCNVSTNPECQRLDLDRNGLINLGGDVATYIGTIGDTCT